MNICEWRIGSTLEEWETVSRSIEELDSKGFSDGFKHSFILALDETFANISAYAYAPHGGQVTIKSEYLLTQSERMAKITFTDGGKRFNPVTDGALPDTKENIAAKRTNGGLGIFIIKKQTDKLEYLYENETNNLTLIKKEAIEQGGVL